jgi:hypothetical protein
MRILSTYEPGETVQFEVMRARRRATVTGRMPQAREGEWRVRPNSFEPAFMPLRDWIDHEGLRRRIERSLVGRAEINIKT